MPAQENPMTPPWTLARRAARLNPSVIRDLLKCSERPEILSLAGGLPAPETFAVEPLRAAFDRVLREAPLAALQYAASEGHGPLREQVAAALRGRGIAEACASRVLITTGSQQGLDLVARVLLDPGSTLAVETPTYLGALQAFSPCEPRFVGLASDGQGARPQALDALAAATPDLRAAYLQPNFQNPSGRLMTAERRAAIVAVAQARGVPLIEDDPYGELWFDAPPPAPLAALWPAGTLLLGSFSKVLAPGLRLGWLLAPAPLYPKLLQAKQAADLHSPGLNQRVVSALLDDGLLERHLPAVRERYRGQAEAMDAALRRHLPPGTDWQRPAGGMFFWLRLPAGLDAAALLPSALAAGVAYVPGSAFHADGSGAATLRLSFVTLSPERIAEAVARLGAVLMAAMAASPTASPAAVS
jgi:2-aminoadipate transaminase